MPLFHKEIYWRDEFTEQVRNILNDVHTVHISQHMKDNLLQKDIGRRNYNKEELVNLDKYKFGYLFEVQTDDYYRVIKFVIRIPYNEKYDCTTVFGVKNGFLVMITAWLNLGSDKHYTLDKSKYMGKEK